ncbi:MAG: hypothetical protein IT553_03135 [Sphingomonadaceae bacterium]|nr:hypothetical protein [Sphingomonadaceae bacterium]
MATLILTSIGTAIGGPLGGAIGALIGRSVDGAIFAPKGRDGARLSDLRVQTSSYGTPIARVLGQMRVAGSVIWATDFVEHRNRSGGKGRPKVTSYSYSVSMAVALSSRPILSVGRIWAEGNLLRGADGSFKSPVQMRVHLGDADQPADPLIVAAEGAAHAPAYRGLAYIVLEDFDLAPFGNRIPALSFEVVADGAPLTLGDIAGDALDMGVDTGVAGDAALALTGWLHEAPTRGGALDTIDSIQTFYRDGTGAWVSRSNAAPLPIGEAVLGGRRRASLSRAASGQLPQAIEIFCHDPARDFQSQLQSARVAGGSGARQRVNLPAAMDAAAALALGQGLAERAALQRENLVWPMGPAAIILPPGMSVVLVDGRLMCVERRRIDGDGFELELADVPPDFSGDGGALGGARDGGRHLPSPDLLPGQTHGLLFDVPRADAGGLSGGLWLAANGSGPGWRGAALSISPVAGAAMVDAQPVNAGATMGQLVAMESAPQSALFDRAGHIDVALLRADMQLTNADDRALLGGANLCLIDGGELLQFGHAAPLGGGLWRLSHLLRGRLGSEDAMTMTAVGSGFALFDTVGLTHIPDMVGLSALAVGGQLALEGMGDAAPVTVAIDKVGRALRPLSPVHGRCEWQGDGSLTIHWQRRSRAGFGWDQALDVSMDEPALRFVVTMQAGAMARESLVEGAQLSLDAADVALWRAAGAPWRALIRQRGAAGDSLALSLPII